MGDEIGMGSEETTMSHRRASQGHSMGSDLIGGFDVEEAEEREGGKGFGFLWINGPMHRTSQTRKVGVHNGRTTSLQTLDSSTSSIQISSSRMGIITPPGGDVKTEYLTHICGLG